MEKKSERDSQICSEKRDVPQMSEIFQKITSSSSFLTNFQTNSLHPGIFLGNFYLKLRVKVCVGSIFSAFLVRLPHSH